MFKFYRIILLMILSKEYYCKLDLFQNQKFNA